MSYNRVVNIVSDRPQQTVRTQESSTENPETLYALISSEKFHPY